MVQQTAAQALCLGGATTFAVFLGGGDHQCVWCLFMLLITAAVGTPVSLLLAFCLSALGPRLGCRPARSAASPRGPSPGATPRAPGDRSPTTPSPRRRLEPLLPVGSGGGRGRWTRCRAAGGALLWLLCVAAGVSTAGGVLLLVQPRLEVLVAEVARRIAGRRLAALLLVEACLLSCFQITVHAKCLRVADKRRLGGDVRRLAVGGGMLTPREVAAEAAVAAGVELWWDSPDIKPTGPPLAQHGVQFSPQHSVLHDRGEAVDGSTSPIGATSSASATCRASSARRTTPPPTGTRSTKRRCARASTESPRESPRESLATRSRGDRRGAA